MPRLGAGLAWASVLCMASLCGILYAADPPRSDSAIGGDFTLTDQDARTFSLHDLAGKVVLLSFGYTYCPDVCPLTLSISARVVEDLAERGRDVVPVFISLDPKRDSPEVLAKYVRYFHPRMIGLTGTPEQLARVAAQYNARFTLQGDAQGDRYTLDHTANLYLIDPSGAVAAIVPYGLPAEHIVRQVQTLLPAQP